MTEKELEMPITENCKLHHVPNSSIKLEPYFTLGEPGIKIHSIKFDPQNRYIAAARDNGSIQVFNVKNKSITCTIKNDDKKVPFTYITWRPENENFKTKNILTTANADGEIQNWHLNSGKCLSTIKEEDKNGKTLDKQLYCIDYTIDGTKIVACGSEPILKVYDEVKRKKIIELKEPNAPHNCHTNRVYCAKFHTEEQNQNLIYSGGWDQTLIVWDIREGFQKPCQNVFGPYVCGDGIATCGTNILTASWRQQEQLQQWDARKEGSFSLNETLDWDGIKFSMYPCFLYTCQFSKMNQDLIAAGGSSANEVKLFDRSNNNKPCCAVYELPREVDTIDFSYDDSKLAISGADGLVRVFTITEV